MLLPERKRIGRRRVKPLHVIGRHQEREVFQEHTKDAENPECDRATCNRPGLASARAAPSGAPRAAAREASPALPRVKGVNTAFIHAAAL
jgi:hypothetical protein